MPRPPGVPVNGKLVADLRNRRNWTQMDLANRLSSSRALVQNAERSGRLSTSMVRRLAEILAIKYEDLVISDSFCADPEARATTPVRKPGSAQVIGTIIGISREMLYELPPRILICLAIRNIARVVIAFGPRSSDGIIHLRALFRGLEIARTAFKREPGWKAISDTAIDDCFLAAGSARPACYEADTRAADVGFASSIAVARSLEALSLFLLDENITEKYPNWWRVIEFATSSCHASGHVASYLTVSESYKRIATWELHDLRNADHLGEIMERPLWGEVPSGLLEFQKRILRKKFFPDVLLVRWNFWATVKFSDNL